MKFPDRPTQIVRVILHHPLVTEEGIEIKELMIPPVFRLSHIEGVKGDTPADTVIELMDRVLGVPEAYARQLSLEDAGVLLALFRQRLCALERGFEETEANHNLGDE